jgi:carbonic anhydrase/acetyltransferase-like protein (isoleucine patch superfamily)
MKVEPESLVLGVPGKVVRKITKEEKEMIDNNWKNYLEYAREYLGGK